MYLKEALENGNIAGDGVFDERVCDFLQKKLASPKILTVTSGTHALELAMVLADIQPGDQVIMPSFTFPSTANAVLLRGGTPVFSEVDENTLCLDLDKLPSTITKQTKAVVPVHYGGVSCPIDRLMSLAKEHQLWVIEDAAQALGSTYHGKSLGTWGHMGCFSFHGTKNLVSGEGGALSINDAEPNLMERADIYRQKGTNRMEFLKGEVSHYTWVDEGSSYAPSDLLMAVLLAQLEEMDHINQRRRQLFELYQSLISPLIRTGRLAGMARIPEGIQANYHNFYVMFHDQATRELVRKLLQSQGIGAVIHFIPLHGSPMGKRLGYAVEDLPVTNRVSAGLLRLPLFTGMEEAQVHHVVERLRLALEAKHEG